MSGIARQGLMIGAAIVVVDWIAGTVLRQPGVSAQTRAVVELADLVANVILYSLAGYLGFKETELVRGGAEVAVIAGTLAGAAASLRLVLSPLPGAPPTGASEVIGLLALNVALGGLLGLSGAAIARVRAR